MLRLLRLLVATFFETMFARLFHGRLLPSWGFQFEWVVRFLRRDALSAARWPLAELRADFDARRYPGRAVAQIELETASDDGMTLVRFVPPRPAEGIIVVYFHGGSYVFGSPRTTHADLIARIALGAGTIVVAPEYRLAPEHPYPAALEDALRAVQALRSAHPTCRLVLAGDSAGANLALSVQLALRDGGHEQAAAAALISPWLDLSARQPSCRENERFDFGASSFLSVHARAFAGTIPLDDARVSPFFANINGLAPVFLQVGGAERLHDEAVLFAERAVKAGVRLELDVVPELPHIPPMHADFHPAGRQALASIVGYLKRPNFAEARAETAQHVPDARVSARGLRENSG